MNSSFVVVIMMMTCWVAGGGGHRQVCIPGYCIWWIEQNQTHGWAVMGVWRSSPGWMPRHFVRNAKDLLSRSQFPINHTRQPTYSQIFHIPLI